MLLAYGLSQCPGDTLSRQLSLQFLINRESLSIHNKFTASFTKVKACARHSGAGLVVPWKRLLRVIIIFRFPFIAVCSSRLLHTKKRKRERRECK